MHSDDMYDDEDAGLDSRARVSRFWLRLPGARPRAGLEELRRQGSRWPSTDSSSRGRPERRGGMSGDVFTTRRRGDGPAVGRETGRGPAPEDRPSNLVLFARGFPIHFGEISPPRCRRQVWSRPRGPRPPCTTEYEQGDGVP